MELRGTDAAGREAVVLVHQAISSDKVLPFYLPEADPRHKVVKVGSQHGIVRHNWGVTTVAWGVDDLVVIVATNSLPLEELLRFARTLR